MNMRLKKVLDDIQKTEDKILELQEYVKKLKIQKKQMEDAEIIKAIRSMKMDSREMLTFLDGIISLWIVPKQIQRKKRVWREMCQPDG